MREIRQTVGGEIFDAVDYDSDQRGNPQYDQDEYVRRNRSATGDCRTDDTLCGVSHRVEQHGGQHASSCISVTNNGRCHAPEHSENDASDGGVESLLK